jgi:tRNA(fMet)-specific endonuclease VapC
MTMYVLDTDTLSLYQHGHPVVTPQVDARPLTDLAITVITVEEQLAGWYSQLRHASHPPQVAAVYLRLAQAVKSLARLPIITYTEIDIQRYDQLKALKLNIGKQDLRIAAIVLENGATLVTRNTRDFQRVPNLTIVDWSQ